MIMHSAEDISLWWGLMVSWKFQVLWPARTNKPILPLRRD
jgi:hypothetical protein